MTFYSQAGQDRFAHELLVLGAGIKRGTFLDIGANNPVEINNTYALEQLGWRGLLVDNSPESMEACEKKRKSAFYLTDAAAPQNWIAALRQAGEICGWSENDIKRIDYLSLDIDQATLACLKNLPLKDIRFSVITIEHDEYRRPGTRDAMLSILIDWDYDILCADVCDQGLSFEIWAVDRWALDIPKEAKDKFRRDGPTEWEEFFR